MIEKQVRDEVERKQRVKQNRIFTPGRRDEGGGATPRRKTGRFGI